MRRPWSPNDERGVVVVFVAMMIVVLLGIAALVVDLGYLYYVRARLQNTADAAVLAAALELPSAAQVQAEAVLYGQLNWPGAGAIIGSSDVEVGNWDTGTKTFSPGGSPVNAVRATAQRSAANGNPVDLIFGPILGIDQSDVGATAIAILVPGGGGSRFLIDNEMFDTDVPAIEAVANSLPGVTTDDLLTDADGDWFIDFYDLAGPVTLSLPTGQSGDEGLFDIDHPAFPFGAGTSPSFEDFLKGLAPSSMLDPLLGVSSVDDPGEYPSFVNSAPQVSPLYKSDVSDLGLVGGVPAVNALGERRGLVAFVVVGVGSDPPGSVLPHLIVQLAPPGSVPLSGISPGVGGADTAELVA